MFKRVLVLGLPLIFFSCLFFTNKSAHAVTGSDWIAGKIITDSIFTDKSAMSVSEIQSFLNNEVPNCDTNGTQTSELGGGTRAQYGAAHGNPPPFTCLKSYYEVPKTKPGPGIPKSNYGGKPRPAGSKSAAHLIWDAAQAYNISPKVLLVTIQKESVGPLITDDWPFKSQYTYAMGAHCPDTAPCDSDYAGFSIQIRESARLFRYYLDNMGESWWTYKKPGVNSILYNPNSSCGSKSVNIVSKATAALYTYTPYTPNKAALDNLYGTGDSCSSYGNRNFWRLYNDWFGSTLKESKVRFISCSGQNYLVENNISSKRLITQTGMDAWKLEDNDFFPEELGCSYPNYSLQLDRLIRSRSSQKLYLVDEGKAYLVANQSVATAWGIGSINQDAPYFNSSSILVKLSTVSTLPQVAKSTNPDVSTVYLIDGDKRYPIADPDSLKLIRGYDEVPMSTFSVSLLQTLTASSTIDYSFKIGSDWYLLDHNKTRKIGSSASARWNSFLSGPTLSSGILNIFGDNTTLSASFKRDYYFYRLLNGPSLEYTNYDYVANDWGVSNSPVITKLLTNKILGDITPDYIQGVTGNVRLVSCSGSKYLVERFIAKRRPITSDGLAAWGFADKYFMVNDKACGYSVYSVSVDQLIRSRHTKKVYYVDSGKAYYVDSQAKADAWGFGNLQSTDYPQFNTQSILDNLQLAGSINSSPPTP